MIKIGYQGIIGSNSYNALKLLIKLEDQDQAIPLITSSNVVKALLEKRIDFGLCAISNNTTGIVDETIEALKTLKIEIINEIEIPIHHCLYVKNKHITKKDIEQIASHEQALKQTNNYIKSNFNNKIELLKQEDTAICADKLINGDFSENTAVIISNEAGETRKLHLLEKNIEDNKNNATKFILFKLINK